MSEINDEPLLPNEGMEESEIVDSKARYNWKTLKRDPASELSGSLGDLGTLLPLVIALTNASSISLSSTLLFTGLWNILSGVFFGVPIVVQPMKLIASVAIAQKFTIGQNMAAGLCTAGIVTFLSVFGLISRLNALIPHPIVKGIQMGVGISLITSSQKIVQPFPWFSSDSLIDNWPVVLLLFLSFFILKSKKLPLAAILFAIGLVIAMFRMQGSVSFGTSLPSVIVPTLADFKTGFFEASIAQLPLTILNSIIAVVAVSEDLLPRREPPGVTHLGLSIGLMNLTGCLFGSMPVCHGSGGLLSQHRFGARSGAAVIVLGAAKILLGLLFGDSLIRVFEQFPNSFLAVMLFTAGLAMLDLVRNINDDAQDIKGECLPESEKYRRWQILMITVALIVSFHNDAVGVIGGLMVHAIHKMQDRMGASGQLSL